jgi:MFS family permease
MQASQDSNTEQGGAAAPAQPWVAALAPLREPVFRRIWTASLLSNFGQLIQGVGAAWEMTRLSSSTGMVALVQTALMVPLMLVAVPAGAIADMFDRRRIALIGLSWASLCAAILTTVDWLGLTTPWLLLSFCSLIGAGVALYGPAWQASVSEQVGAKHLPAAVGLGSVSYNLARSFGPAVGGVIVLAAGAMAAFAVNAVFYLPLLLAFYFWRRPQVAPRLPPERIDRAIISGARYVIHSPRIRTVIIRVFAFGLASAASSALAPLVARTLLKGDASTYGLLLGGNGVGAVAGALMVGHVREKLKAEHAVRLCLMLAGTSVLLLGLSRNLALSMLLLGITGASTMLMLALLNVAVQLSSPRWVTARALAWYQSSLTCGVGVGAWMWGHAAANWGVDGALIGSGIALFLSPLIGLLLPMPSVALGEVEEAQISSEPQVGLPLTARSGPIAIEVDYRVEPEQARQFYDVMRKLQSTRQRNGAFDWSLSRDIADPVLWTERYSCPTWGDYLRMRSRFTTADRELQLKADAFHTISGPGSRVRRRLERPFGSVRWRAETPDPQREAISPYLP